MEKGNIKETVSLLEKKTVSYPLLTALAGVAYYAGSYFTDQGFFNKLNKGVKSLISYIF